MSRRLPNEQRRTKDPPSPQHMNPLISPSRRIQHEHDDKSLSRHMPGNNYQHINGPSHAMGPAGSSSPIKPLSFDEAVRSGSPPPPLKLDEKIVWLSDNGPEFGTIKWLGKLPDVGREWMAGVQFENPVGSGTGLYNGYQLFQTELNHASLVPVIGLMKQSEFMGTDSGASQPAIPVSSPTYSSQSSHVSVPLVVKLPARDNRYTGPASKTTTRDCHFTPNYNNPSTTNSLSRDHRTILNHSSMAAHGSLNRDSHFASAVPSTTLNGYNRDSRSAQTSNGSTNSLTRDYKHTQPCQSNGIHPYSINDVPPPYKGLSNFDGFAEDELDSSVKSQPCNRKNTGYDNDIQINDSAHQFGSIDCPAIPGEVPPLHSAEDLHFLCGKNRGIQGHHNSCYLDATLFAMFSCTTVFESLLRRPRNQIRGDIPEYEEVQRILKEEIVNPLRANLYVRADRVMKLRTILEKLSSVRGLTSEEKDPEEFLNLLLNEILKAEPYLKLSSGLESFFYQLFIEKDETLQLPTVQQLFDQSFLASNLKLSQVPQVLLMQMPRHGRNFKMYSRIIPTLYLDITDVLDNSLRQCAICGSIAEHECKECFRQFGEGLDSTAFCASCLERCHSHKKRQKHKTTPLRLPDGFTPASANGSLTTSMANNAKNNVNVPRAYMELFAVLCIETSHYVSFVKCGSGPDAPWCFFDSMADRKGEENGYNIPEITPFPDLKWWLSEEGIKLLLNTKDDKLLPEMPRRFLCDAYMCFYQSTDLINLR